MKISKSVKLVGHIISVEDLEDDESKFTLQIIVKRNTCEWDTLFNYFRNSKNITIQEVKN